jgi:hypothetical protein
VDQYSKDGRTHRAVCCASPRDCRHSKVRFSLGNRVVVAAHTVWNFGSRVSECVRNSPAGSVERASKKRPRPTVPMLRIRTPKVMSVRSQKYLANLRRSVDVPKSRSAHYSLTAKGAERIPVLPVRLGAAQPYVRLPRKSLHSRSFGQVDSRLRVAATGGDACSFSENCCCKSAVLE